MPLLPSIATVTEDERVLIEAVREFSLECLLEADRRCDEDETPLTGTILPDLSQMGLLGLVVPESLGGLGVRYQTYAAIIHELAYASPSTAVAVSVHSMVGHILNKGADEPRRSEWLSNWGSAESFAAFAISEADAGSDPSAARTAADEVAGGYRLSGEKMWITNGMTARWFLTLARIRGGATDGQLSMFMVDGQTDGITRTSIHGKTGIRGSDTAVIAFDGVFVPADHILGWPGDGGRISALALNGGRVGIAAQATGIAEACLDAMRSYASQRIQFGRPIGKFQAVQNMIVESAVLLETARLLIWRAAQSIDSGHDELAPSSMAKLRASEAANRIAYLAVQVHGGMGLVKECRVEQLYRDVRVTTIYEGTSEIQRYVIAKSLVPRDFFRAVRD